MDFLSIFSGKASRFFQILFLFAQGWCGIAQAGSGMAARSFERFCADLAIASRIEVDGPAGDALLEECLFSAGKPRGECVLHLGTTKETLWHIRGNRAYFTISGSPMNGFYLWPSDRRLRDIERASAQSPYSELVRLRLGIEETDEKLRRKRFLEESNRREKEGQAPFQWGGGPPRVEPSDLAGLQIKYVVRLENQLQREQNKRIARCLRGQLKRFLPAFGESEEGKLRTLLAAEATALAAKVRTQLRLPGAWRAFVLQVDMLHGQQASPIGVVLLFENRAQHKVEEFLDARMRIFPWFEIALVDPAYDRKPAPSPHQPVISSEPGSDRRVFNYLGRSQRFQIFYRSGMLPFFRSDCETLPDWLRASAGENSPIRPLPKL